MTDTILKQQVYTVTIVYPQFGSIGTLQYLEFLAHSKGKQDPVLNKKYRKSHTCVVEFEFMFDYQVATFTKELNKIFNPSYLTVSIASKNRFNSDWDEFENMVNTHDRYYDYSDDHRVWAAGDENLKRIRDFANKLRLIDNERVDAILKRLQ